MKSEQDIKMYEIVMETAYPNHWEFLLRKARTLAQQYKIPYVSISKMNFGDGT
jgi:hypothetical protein